MFPLLVTAFNVPQVEPTAMSPLSTFTSVRPKHDIHKTQFYNKLQSTIIERNIRKQRGNEIDHEQVSLNISETECLLSFSQPDLRVVLHVFESSFLLKIDRQELISIHELPKATKFSEIKEKIISINFHSMEYKHVQQK